MTETGTQVSRQSWLRSRFGMPVVTGRAGILTAVGIDTIGLGLFLPISLLYFTLTTDVPVSQVGVALSLATFTALPTGAIGGMLVDRFGDRVMMAGNNLLSAFGYVVYIFAAEPEQIFVGALLIAIADRTYWACWPPYVTRVAGKETFHRWFAFLESLKSACMALGALVAGLILAAGPGAAMARVIVGLNVLSSVIAAVLFVRQPGNTSATGRHHEAVQEPRPAWSTLLRQPRYVLPLLAQSFVAPTWLLVSVALPVYYVVTWNLAAWLPATMFAVGNVLVFGAQTPVAHALRHWRKERIVALAAVAVCMAMTLLTVVGLWTARTTAVAYMTAVGVGLLLATAYLLYVPAAYAISMEAAEEGTRGRAAAMFDVGTAITAAAGPAVMSALVIENAVLLWLGVAASVLIGVAFFTAHARWAAAGELRIR